MVVVNQQYSPTKVTNVALARVCCKVEVVVATYPANYYSCKHGDGDAKHTTTTKR